MSSTSNSTTGKENRRRARLALLLVGVSALALLAAIVGRVYVSGETELGLGRQALTEGNTVAAQKHFLFAARWYLPLVATSGDAVRELLALGELHAGKGNFPEAVAAYDDARGALYATAWLAGPDQELLTAANEGFSASLAGWKKQREVGTNVAEETARYQRLTAAVETTNPWWSLLMGLSFLAYAGLLGLAAWKWEVPGFKKVPCLAGAGASFIVWIVSMFLI